MVKKCLVISLFILALAFVACKQQPGVYRIGVLIPKTGEAEGYGQQVQNGVQLALDEINDRGGIAGKKMDMIVEDDESNEQKAIEKAKLLITQDRVPLIIGGVTSTEARAIAPVCESSKVVLLSPSASSPKLTKIGPYFFRNYPSDTLEGRVMADYAVRYMGVKSVAIVFSNNEYGQGLRDIFKERFSALGGKVPYEQGYPEGTTDFSQMVKDVKAAKPDAVYLPGYYTEVAGILKEMQKQDLKTVKKMAGGGVANPQFLELAEDSAEGLIYAQPPYDPKSTEPAVQRFVSTYSKKFMTEPGVYAAYAYDAMRIVQKAIENSGEKYPADLRDRIADTSGFKGVTGDVAFDSNGDVDIQPKIFEVKAGKFVPVK